MKVLTAYNEQHEKFLWECTQSVPDGFEHVIQYDEGRGKAWAMNQMLQGIADDDVIVVCDADDRLMPIIEDLVWMLDRHDLVYGDVYEEDESGNVKIYRSRSFDINVFKTQNFIPFSGVMMWGWFAKKVTYPDCFPVEDWIWWHRLYQHSQNFGYSNFVHATRRVWTSNVARNIPVYSKIRRLMRNYKAKQVIKSIYESKGNTDK